MTNIGNAPVYAKAANGSWNKIGVESPWADAPTATTAHGKFKAVPAGFTFGTNLVNAFNGWAALTTVPALDTSAVTNMGSMFSGCAALTTIPAMDTSAVTTMGGMFANCAALTIVPPLNAASVTTVATMFNGCTNLTKAQLPGLKVTLGISNCKFQAAELNDLFTSLGTANSGAIITITNNPGAATCNRSIATNKGWTVSG